MLRVSLLLLVLTLPLARAEDAKPAPSEPAPAPAAPAPPRPIVIGKQGARRAVDVLRLEPNSQRGREAAALVMKFAETNPDVEVTISEKALPWLKTKTGLQQRHISTLVAAYVAGNIRTQIDRDKKADDPASGVEQVIETYQLLQLEEPGLKNPEIEKFIDMKRAGQLRAYFAAK